MPDTSEQSDTLLYRVASVCLLFGVSRLLLTALVLLSREVFAGGEFLRAGGLLDVLTQWDAGWYLSIARDGYSYYPGLQSNVTFFPLFPLLMKVVSLATSDLAIAGVLVSNVCFLAAAILLQELMRLDYPADARVSRSAIAFLMFSPVSFFFSSPFTESTFLLLAVGAFLAARADRWLIACLCGACLSATRNVGVLIVILLLVEFIHQRWDPRRPLRSVTTPRVLWLALVPLGLILFFVFCHFRLGDPFVYLKSAGHWGRTLVPPWQTLMNAANLPLFYRWLFGTTFTAGVVIWIVCIVLRLRLSYLVFSGLLLTVYICGNSLESIPRYLSVVFPLFIGLGVLTVRYRWMYEPLLAASCALLALCTILWANGYWMT